MSLNRHEQAIYDYWDKQPDERRHWQTKITDLTRGGVTGDLARPLERELWEYFVERRQHVPQLRTMGLEALPRVSLLNLSEHLIRIWGPIPKPKKQAATR